MWAAAGSAAASSSIRWRVERPRSTQRPGADVGPHAGQQRLAEADEAAADVRDHGGRVQRPERGPAGERDGHRVAAEVVRLAPPPDRREAVAPVALHVRGRALEVPVAHSALGAGAQHERAPVLTQDRQMAGRAGAMPRPRPRHDVVQAGVDAVEPHVPRVARERAADPHAGVVGDWVVEDRRLPAAGLPGHADERPAGAHAAEDDRGPSVGPREAPEPARQVSPAGHPDPRLMATSGIRPVEIGRATPSRPRPWRWPPARRARSRRDRRPGRARRCRPRSPSGGP